MKYRVQKNIYGRCFITKRVKDSTVERAELMDEIMMVLRDYFDCEFTHEGEIHYMKFDDGDVYALNLVKCNNFTAEEKTEEK